MMGKNKEMDERPNFLVIMTDQQRGDCLSSAGHPVLMTPNMDQSDIDGDLIGDVCDDDIDGDGSINYEEFIRGLRDELSERKLAMVERTFSCMD